MRSPFEPTVAALPHELLRVGQPVHVNVGRWWLAATVTAVAVRQVDVAYQASMVAPLGSRVPPWLVRPADGIALKPVDDLTVGDRLVGFDGTTSTVAARPWQGHDGNWQFRYTDGTRASIPAGTVLRLLAPGIPRP